MSVRRAAAPAQPADLPVAAGGRDAPRSRARLAGIALIAVSAASFGVMAVLARVAYDAGAEPMGVLVVRFCVAAPLLWAVVAMRKAQLPRRRTLGALALLGGVGYVGQSLAFFSALEHASAGLVALLLYLHPALVTVLAAVFLRARLTPVRIAALALACGGSVLTVGPAGRGSGLGVALALTAAAIYSVYIVVGSQVTARAGALVSSTVVITAAAAVYLAAALAANPALPRSAEGWAALAGIAVVSTVVAILTFFAGMARLGPSDAATLSTLEPVVTLALAAVVLDESVAPVQLAGGALILIAVVVLGRARSA